MSANPLVTILRRMLAVDDFQSEESVRAVAAIAPLAYGNMECVHTLRQEGSQASISMPYAKRRALAACVERLQELRGTVLLEEEVRTHKAFREKQFREQTVVSMQLGMRLPLELAAKLER